MPSARPPSERPRAERPRAERPLAEPPQAPLATRAGSLLGASTLAALIASMPATIRVAHEGGGVIGAWMALAACALVPSIVAVAVMRSARESARALAGADGGIVAWAVGAWGMLTFLALAAYGALLRATTHHHGLAGVTFAMGGVAIGVVLALVVRRLASMARDADPWGRAALLVAILAALGCAILVVVIRVARAGGLEVPFAWLVDALAFVIAAGALSRRAFVAVPWLSRGGLPLALGVLVLGAALLVRGPALLSSIRANAPLFAPVAALVASR